jgi:hypothetical protein
VSFRCQPKASCGSRCSNSDNLELGIANARKGWLTPANVLNTRTADEVLAFARARREGATMSSPPLRVMQG